jgi:hypothetical protein
MHACELLTPMMLLLMMLLQMMLLQMMLTKAGRGMLRG